MTHQNTKLAGIERAVKLIQTEMAEDRTPALKDLAKAAGLSPFHFHRTYKLLTGETCKETITRLKLARGTSTLQQSNVSVTEAAFVAGYSSSQAFAKVIKRVLDTSASDIRSDPERLAQTIQTLISPDTVSSGETAPAMRIEISSIEPLEVLTIRTEDRYPDLIDIYTLLFETAGGPQNVRAVLGLPEQDIELSDEPGFIFQSALLPQNPVKVTTDSVGSTVIRSGLYLLTRHKGLDADQPETLDALYRIAIASPDIKFADSPCIYHYIDDPEEVEEALCRTDIYLPITYAAP